MRKPLLIALLVAALSGFSRTGVLADEFDEVIIRNSGLVNGNLVGSNAQHKLVNATPVPTATPQVFPTPAATATAVPTATPANTPVPTATVVPTSTPAPTPTTIPAYDTVQDEGIATTQWRILNCIGDLIACATDVVNSRTNLTITNPTPAPTATPAPTTTPVPTATPIPAVATPTPLVFGTPGVIPVFAATELGAYAGNACPTPGVATSISAAGALGCATPVPTATVVPTPTPGNTPVPTATVVPTPTPVTVKLVVSGITTTNMNTGVTTYFPVYAGSTTGTESNTQTIMTVAGTAKNMRCFVTVAPNNGAGTQSWAFTLRVNTASPASGPTCTISETATTCSDTTDTATIAAGDKVSFQSVPSGTPANSGGTSCGFELDPS